MSTRGVSFIWMRPNSKERANSGGSRWLVSEQGDEDDEAFPFPLSDMCPSLHSTVFSSLFFRFLSFFNWLLGVVATHI